MQCSRTEKYIWSERIDDFTTPFQHKRYTRDYRPPNPNKIHKFLLRCDSRCKLEQKDFDIAILLVCLSVSLCVCQFVCVYDGCQCVCNVDALHQVNYTTEFQRINHKICTKIITEKFFSGICLHQS